MCITGVVQGWAAILMGLVSGSVPWYTMMILHNKLSFLKAIDDPMAVFHTHAVAGILGGVLTGFFAVPKLCRLFYMVPDWDKYIGLAYALQNRSTSPGLRQMGIQLAAIAFVICFNVVITSFVCLLVRTIVPLRVETQALAMGDKAVHGEDAFALWSRSTIEGKRFQNLKHNQVYDREDYPSFASRSMSELQMV